MSEPSAEDFADIAMALHDAEGVVGTVELVLEHALQAVGCRYAGITFVHGANSVETAAVTDPVVEKLDRIQAESGEGPGTEALAGGAQIVVADTTDEPRWPHWAEGVAALGIRSVLSVGLSTETADIGLLTLYDDRPGAFDRDDQAVASIFARHAAVALAEARKAENLWLAIDARKLIGQAQGILMERFDLSAEQAFGVLLRYSQHNNMKLRAVADEVVHRRGLPRV